MARLGIDAPLYIIQSNGGMTTPANAMARPIEIIECGPAAGVGGATRLAAAAGRDDLVTFDMGGTTAKASIVEGARSRVPPTTKSAAASTGRAGCFRLNLAHFIE